MPLPENDEQARKHWQAQQPSIDRPLGSKDRGLTQVGGAEEAGLIISREIEGAGQPVFRTRTAQDLPDPTARAVKMVRGKVRKNHSSDRFLKNCETPLDLALHALLYEDMPADKRAGLLLKFSKQLADQQLAQERLNLQARNLEDKRVKNAVELERKFAKLRNLGVMEAQPIPPRDGDA